MTRTLLVVDGHTLFRAGLVTLLRALMPDATVGEAADAGAALDAASRIPPDVALVDVSLSGGGGLQLTQQIKALHPRCRVIAVSTHTSPDRVSAAIRHGADAYLARGAAVADVSLAIDRVLAGGRYLSRDLPPELERLLEDPDALPDPLASLSPRQRQILQMVVEGESTKEIGYRLGLSHKTVETHRRAMARRLGIHDTATLTRFAIKAGLTSVDA